MWKAEYDELQKLIQADCNVPDDLFPKDDESDVYCYFLFRYCERKGATIINSEELLNYSMANAI